LLAGRAHLRRPITKKPGLLGRAANSLGLLFVIPIRCYVGAAFVEVHVLINMTDPGYRDEVMMLAVGRALFRQLYPVGAVEMIDFSDHLSVGGSDVYVLPD
jgi:hypothetical protein